MAIIVNIYYKGEGNSARDFAREMIKSGTADKIRREAGNLRYEYFLPFDKPDTVLLIDSWESKEALDIHHNTPMMKEITRLREKYNLHMTVERYVSDDEYDASDMEFVRK